MTTLRANCFSFFLVDTISLTVLSSPAGSNLLPLLLHHDHHFVLCLRSVMYLYYERVDYINSTTPFRQGKSEITHRTETGRAADATGDAAAADGLLSLFDGVAVDVVMKCPNVLPAVVFSYSCG